MFRDSASMLRTVLAASVISAGAATAAHASFVSNSPDPFLGSQVDLNSAVFSTPFGYSDQEIITNFGSPTVTNVGGNLVEDYTATMDVTFYTSYTGTLGAAGSAVAGTVTGSAMLTGVFDVTEMGRASIFSVGDFTEMLNKATFSGLVAGQNLTVSLNPAHATVGMAMIAAGPGVGQFTINNPFTVFGGFAVGNGPFTPTPTITANNFPVGSTTPVPEPATLALFGASLIGMAFVRRQRGL